MRPVPPAVADNGTVTTRRPALPTERTVLRGFTAARWLLWAWMVANTWLQRDQLRHRDLAVVGLVIALVVASGATAAVRNGAERLLHPGWVVGDLVVAFGLLVLDGFVWQRADYFAVRQNLAGSWPLIVVVSAAVAVGPARGLAAGVLVGSGRTVAALVNAAPMSDATRLSSLTATVLYLGLAGVTVGWVARRLRTVETEVTAQRARDEVAVRLHDGVLQTLAVVARRAERTDPSLAALARRSDRELRAWLFGVRAAADDHDGLETAVRREVDEVALLHDVATTVSVLAGEREPSPEVARAIAGAAREAVVNAAKHAGSPTVVVFVEVDDDGSVFASVRDDGCGFDPATTPRGQGLHNSIEGRIAHVGGRTEVVSSPGRGTEIRLWVPGTRP